MRNTTGRDSARAEQPSSACSQMEKVNDRLQRKNSNGQAGDGMTIKTLLHLLSARRAIIIAILAGFLAGFTIAKICANPYADLLTHELSRYSSGEWIVRIDGETIGSSYIDERARLYTRHIAPREESTDPLFRDKLLRKLVDNYIVVKAAEKSGLFSGENARRYLWMYIEEAVAGYYLDTMADLRTKRPGMTDKEIDEFYNEHEVMFTGNSIPREKALEMIRSGFDGISRELTFRDRLTARRIELGRLKKGKKILLNHSLPANKALPSVSDPKSKDTSRNKKG